MKTPAYFDADGNYGSALPEHFVILETSDWTSAMWDVISDSGDTSRLMLAQHFDAGKHSMFFDESVSKWVCETCELTNDDLPNKLEPDVIY